MRKAIIVGLTTIVLLTSPCSALAGKHRVKIYDENSKWVGTIEGNRLYDNNYQYKGTIQKDRIYNEKSQFKGTIQRDKNKSRHHHHEEED